MVLLIARKHHLWREEGNVIVCVIVGIKKLDCIEEKVTGIL